MTQPPARDRLVDIGRAIATFAIITIHWLMPEATWNGTHLEVGNALAYGSSWLLTWPLQLLAVLFFASGAAAGYQRQHTLGRTSQLPPSPWAAPLRGLRRITPPVGVFAASWLTAVIVLPHLGVPTTAVEVAARFAPQLLWFLGVWLILLGLTGPLQRAWSRFGSGAIVVAIIAPLLVDVLRFTAGLEALGWLNVILVWQVPYLLGIARAFPRTQRSTRRSHVRRLQWAGTLGATVAAILLVALGPYSASMIGMPGAEISNLAPPTAPALMLGIAQVGALLLAAQWLLARTAPSSVAGRLVAWTASRSMTLYLWHLSAMIVVVGMVVVGAGLVLPTAWSADWWISRPLWWGACIAVLAVLVRLMGPVEHPGVGHADGRARYRHRDGDRARTASFGPQNITDHAGGGSSGHLISAKSIG